MYNSPGYTGSVNNQQHPNKDNWQKLNFKSFLSFYSCSHCHHFCSCSGPPNPPHLYVALGHTGRVVALLLDINHKKCTAKWRMVAVIQFKYNIIYIYCVLQLSDWHLLSGFCLIVVWKMAQKHKQIHTHTDRHCNF